MSELDNSAQHSDSNRKVVKFSLDMKPEDFHQTEVGFLDELAEVVEVRPEQIWIVDVHAGCTMLRLELPEAAQRRLERYSRSVSAHPKVIDFLRKYRCKWLSFDDQFKKHFHNINTGYPNSRGEQLARDKGLLGEERDSGRKLTWLHLSDIHLRYDDGARGWAQNKGIATFMKFLPDLLSEANLEPDLVFLSGDLAFSGREEEYSGAVVDFFHQLRETLPKRSYFFCIPGNHDVSWDLIDPDLEARLRRELSNESAVLIHLLDTDEQQKQDRERGFERLRHFFQFMQTCDVLSPIEMNEGYCYCAKISHQGIKVGIAGLNSAWRSTRKGDPSVDVDLDLQHLLLSEPQVDQVFGFLEDVQLKIALVHHPPFSEWFTSFDAQMQKVELLKFDFILRGHEHREQLMRLESHFPVADESVFHIASGALYAHEDYPNNFNAVQIDLDTGKVTNYWWEYDRWRRVWRKHTYRDANGQITFPLPVEVRQRLGIATD
jgi:predicted MPP superfamily phosphohydrolase